LGIRGMLLAALSGAIMSALAAVLNSASTIFTLDFYKRFINKKSTDKQDVFMGRASTITCTIIACALAPYAGKLSGIFQFMQTAWGCFSPGITAAILFGLVFRKAPTAAAMSALIGGVIVYGGGLIGMHYKVFPEIASLNLMAITFIILVAIMGVITAVAPLKVAVEFKKQDAAMDLRSSPLAKVLAVLVVILVAGVYIILR
jgi:solute:Na+ symporter, SSS family